MASGTPRCVYRDDFVRLKVTAPLLVSVPFVFCRLSVGCGPLFVWPIFKNGSTLLFLILCSVLVKVSPRLTFGIPLLSTLRKFSATLGKGTCTSSLLMLLNPLIRWITIFLAVLQAGSVFQPGSAGSALLPIGKFGSASCLPLAELRGQGMGAFPKDAPSVWFFLVARCAP